MKFKKVLLVPGSLLALGLLAACGSKATGPLTYDNSAYDKYFVVPDGLNQIDDGVALTHLNEARANLKYAKSSTYNVEKNIMSTFASVQINGPSTDLAAIAQIEEAVPAHQLDNSKFTTQISNDFKHYDNDILDYRLIQKTKSVLPAGQTLTLKNSDFTYTTWIASKKVQDESVFFRVRSQTKGSDNVGAADDVVYRKNYGEWTDDLDECVETINAAATAQHQEIFDKALAGKEIEQARLFVPAEDTLISSQYYVSKNKDTIYCVDNYQTGVSKAMPSYSAYKNSNGGLISLYSTKTRVSKLEYNKVYGWLLDYTALNGKIFASQDENLNDYATPRCVSSEYYLADASYSSVGTHEAVVEDETVTEYDALPFNIGVTRYEFSDMYIGGYVSPKPVIYDNSTGSVDSQYGIYDVTGIARASGEISDDEYLYRGIFNAQYNPNSDGKELIATKRPQDTCDALWFGIATADGKLDPTTYEQGDQRSWGFENLTDYTGYNPDPYALHFNTPYDLYHFDGDYPEELDDTHLAYEEDGLIEYAFSANYEVTFKFKSSGEETEEGYPKVEVEEFTMFYTSDIPSGGGEADIVVPEKV